MKRGDYVPPTGSTTAQVRDTNLLVDFDRKWAETGQASGFMSSDEESDSADGNNELVEYEDEFGRQRQGTRAEANREARRRAAQAHAAETLEELSARPAPPPQLIRGDVIQSAAFNPDAQIAAQMEELARRRDRSLTPPPASHYDANSEIRSKGVGFYAFSREEGERKREMEALERQRQETERKRAAEAHEVGSNHPQPFPTKDDNNNNETGSSNPASNPTIHIEEEEQEEEKQSQPSPLPNPLATSQPFNNEVGKEAADLADRFLDSLDDEGVGVGVGVR